MGPRPGRVLVSGRRNPKLISLGRLLPFFSQLKRNRRLTVAASLKMPMMLKTRCLGLLLTALAPFVTHAERFLNEPFDYADGATTSVAPGLWINHSGAAEQSSIESGAAFITGAEAEDINRTFSPTGIKSGQLFASFDLTLTGLPSSGGGYFFHFKDTGTGAASTFLGRVFARTSGAAADKFRLGISLASTTTIIPIEKDLDLNAAYKVVLRLDFGATNATLWINPATETQTSDRAVSTDTAGFGVGISQVGLRQATGIGNIRLDNLLVGTRFADVAEGGNAALNPPVLSTLPTQRTSAGVATPALALTVADGETPVADLVLNGVSGNETLVPSANITFGGSGSDRTVTVQPAVGQQGIARIALTVRDTDGNSSSRSFDLIVGEPSLSGVADLVTLPGNPTNLVVQVKDTESDALTVTATAANTELLTAVTVTGSGNARTIRVTPSDSATGASRIEVVVTDGFNSITNSFNVTVAKTLGVILNEPFDYPDGTLLNLTGLWIPHSGTNDGPVTVNGGKAQLITTNREDINITYNSPTVRIADGVILYARVDVNFVSAPTSANGSYFAHYLGTAGGSFRGRIFAGRRDLPAGQFQIGLANNSATASVWHPTVLTTGEPVTILVRYNVSTGISTLWVNPSNETSPSVTGTDSPFPNDMVSFALRQDTGFGSLDVDAIKIGTAYADVLTPVVVVDYSLAASLSPDGSARFTFPASALASGFVLQASSSPTSGWTAGPTVTTEGGNAILVVPASAATQFYRLNRP